ncbi:hypothetical protein P4U97_03775 [Bacillus swezeyi]|nr:hypothetical protein [Bacillus swezeyi]
MKTEKRAFKIQPSGIPAHLAAVSLNEAISDEKCFYAGSAKDTALHH